MRKVFKFSIFLALAIMVIVLLLAVAGTSEETEPASHVNVSAKVVEYETADEMAGDADVIAVCEKISEDDSTVMKNSDGDIIAVYTISNVRIKSVEKGDFEEGDVLEILENQGYDESSNTVYHIAGYEKMQTGREYLLLLRESQTDSYYIPLGVNAGKIPVETTEAVVADCAEASLEEYVKNLQENVREFYKDII